MTCPPIPNIEKIRQSKRRNLTDSIPHSCSEHLRASVSENTVTMLGRNIWPASLLRNYPSLSVTDQTRLLKSRIAIIGCGGLGGYLAGFCARMGVGTLVLADNDTYDVTNLNRQCLCTTETLGNQKAVITAQHCRDIHPWIETRVITEKIGKSNAGRLIDGVDLVLDGLDKIADRLTVFEAAHKLGIPFIHGAVTGWCGQTTTFLPDTKVGLEIIYHDKNSVPSSLSVLAPTAAIIAALQCQEALRILTCKKPKNEGILVYFDGEEMRMQRLKLLPDGPKSKI